MRAVFFKLSCWQCYSVSRRGFTPGTPRRADVISPIHSNAITLT